MRLLASLSGVFFSVHGLDNGLGNTPQMGYNTWNDFECEGVSEENITKVADKMVDLGLPALGYEYLVIDDCWAHRRGEDGILVPYEKAFPHGMKNVADYVHDKGLKFGIYTDRGRWTCAGRPGGSGYEVTDAQTFVSWGVDYVKTDSCFGPDSLEDPPSPEAIAQYELFRDALNKTGRKVFLALSGWHNWYSPYGKSLANSWRIGYDVRDWRSAWNYAIRVNAFLSEYGGPGGWNDPDMLVGSSSGAAVKMTPQQSRTQFSLWSVMAAPLLLGSSMLSMSSHDLETYTNAEVIAVDQDPLGIQGQIVWENCPLRKRADVHQNQYYDEIPYCQQAWAKPVRDGFALVLLNLDRFQPAKVDFKVYDVCWSSPSSKSCDFFEDASVRDLWSKQELGVRKSIQVTLDPDGASRMFKLVPLKWKASETEPAAMAATKSQRRPALRPQRVGMGPPLILETDTVHFLQEPTEL
ncbi:putative alpha-galactosidase [Symbiodinium microadriaticum]|uniref:Alpha-galactosidase n=1 Tax=Symbiodinium microadriaticum TaxID=2951 RepID=A0A1Q9D7P7_SYMMI|nr:putative alpha-galactosidase [Symbiodinium microadriaticum]CAE7255349.1 AGAL3 [Symbiodinium microadriaticum]CAE7712768.1 AGAL3 [Symbiodinium sp. KB8]